MSAKSKGKGNLVDSFLYTIEKVGNGLPHPVTLFVIFSLIIIAVSEICYRAGVSVTYQAFSDGKAVDTTVTAVSLFNADGIRYIFSSMVKNFTGYAPLGTVLVGMIGVGVAEGVGLIDACLRKVVLGAPKGMITAIVVFCGVMSNIASDVGYVVLIPLGAVVFLSFNRHPLAGIAAAFAGVSGGFSANLLLGTTDPLLGGISQSAAQMMRPDYLVAPTANYFFMCASTVLITILGTLITEKVVEPHLGKYEGEHAFKMESLTELQKKGLRNAGISVLIFVAIMLITIVPANGVLRNPNPEAANPILHSPFMDGMIPIIMFFFMIPGIVYGFTAKTVKNDKDIAKLIGKSLGSMGGYLILAFTAAQFINFFNYSKLGTILAVNGAELLESIGFKGFPLIISFILITAFINLFMGSASAKWSIMAPIFVPMFMQLGYTPEFTQCLYRIGDSSTNIISPLMSYFALIVAFVQKYDKEGGMGTLISMMLPYSAVFLVFWTLFMIVWYALGLPIGPGINIYM